MAGREPGRRRRPDARPAPPPVRAPRPFQPTAGKPCEHYPDCVGCPLIGRRYGEQLDLKRELVRRALAEYASLAAVEVPEVIGSPSPFGYRNQVKLVVRHARRGLLLGVYRPGSHQVVDIRHCPVHHPIITAIIEQLAAAIEELGIHAYDERSQRGVLRYVVVRVGTWNKTAQVILVTNGPELPQREELLRRFKRLREVDSVVLNINAEPGNVIFGKEFRVLSQRPTLMEKVNGLKLLTSAGAFLQANTNIAARIYRRAAEWAAAEKTDKVVDLYCGVGAVTFHLAEHAQLAIGIEDSRIAVADAKVNARLNGFHNVRFRAGNTADLLPEVTAELERIEVITLNPPRRGADAEARAAIRAAGPRRIVYISCDPHSLARDLDDFVAHGYRVEAIQPYDMMPQTEHVETVALLVHKNLRWGPL